MAALDPGAALAASPRLRRRRRRDRTMRAGATAAAIIAVAVLGIMIATVVAKGASQLSISFLIDNPAGGSLVGVAGGGIANAIIGSALLVAVATAMALPVGVLIAIYLTEFSTPRTARPIRMALDLLNGLPTIVTGIFVYGLLVASHGQSGIAAAFALAVVILPLITRTTQEMLLLVSKELRDASHALGVSRWRTIVGVVLPGALGGILTGVVLAVARAAGETAPLLLTCSIFSNRTTIDVFGAAIPNIPIDIFSYSESPFPVEHAKAWGAALVLIAMILVGNLTARALLARQRRRLGWVISTRR